VTVNLEAIAMRRAEEQLAAKVWRYDERNERVANDRSRTGRTLLCACGTCRRCKNRIAMRQYRALSVKPPPRTRGPSMALGRTCGHVYRDGSCCKTPIADWNTTGVCGPHRRQAWDVVNRSRARLAERGIAA
jgi:hypothetical protein